METIFDKFGYPLVDEFGDPVPMPSDCKFGESKDKLESHLYKVPPVDSQIAEYFRSQGHRNKYVTLDIGYLVLGSSVYATMDIGYSTLGHQKGTNKVVLCNGHPWIFSPTLVNIFSYKGNGEFFKIFKYVMEKFYQGSESEINGRLDDLETSVKEIMESYHP